MKRIMIDKDTFEYQLLKNKINRKYLSDKIGLDYNYFSRCLTTTGFSGGQVKMMASVLKCFECELIKK